MTNDRQPPEAPAPKTGPLPFDAGKYREHVDELDLTEEQKVEFLRTLWWIMSAFVDLGFRVDSVQRLLPAFAEASSNADSDTLQQDCAPAFAEASAGAPRPMADESADGPAFAEAAAGEKINGEDIKHEP